MGDNLNTLQSLFPSRPRSELAKYLSASSDDLSRAFAAVERNALARPAKRARTTGPGGLENWLGKKGKGGKEVEEISLVSSDEEEKDAKPLQPPSTSTKPQRPILDAYSLLKPSVQSVSASSTCTAASTAPAPAIVNLPPLRLTTPAMIAQHTHGLVTLVENALPTELAGRLYVKMVAESEGKGTEEYAGQPWMPNKWFLVDREVTSPHTSSFYRESPASLSSTGGGYDQAAFDEVRVSLCFRSSPWSLTAFVSCRPLNIGTTASPALPASSPRIWTKRGNSSASSSERCKKDGNATRLSGRVREGGGPMSRRSIATEGRTRCVALSPSSSSPFSASLR